MEHMLNIQNPEFMHHAYVVQGDTEYTLSVVLDFIEKTFSITPGNPDLSVLNRTDLGVQDIQEIIDLNIRKAISGRKFIVVSASSISHQAQNSLLKTLEEPRSGTYIFLLLNTSAMLLPTVLSRVHVLSVDSHENKENEEPGRNLYKTQKNLSQIDELPKRKKKDSEVFNAKVLASDFVETEIPNRLEIVKKILKEKEDERIGDMEIHQFVELVEQGVIHKIERIKDPASRQKIRTDFAKVGVTIGEYIYDTSSSKKLLLEYLALLTY